MISATLIDYSTFITKNYDKFPLYRGVFQYVGIDLGISNSWLALIAYGLFKAPLKNLQSVEPFLEPRVVILYLCFFTLPVSLNSLPTIL